MSPEFRRASTLRFEGIASVVFGFGSLFLLVTVGIPLSIAVVAIATVAQRHEGVVAPATAAPQSDAAPDAAGTTSVPAEIFLPGVLVLLGVGLAVFLVDVLIGWTGLRILSHHPEPSRPANLAALVALPPAAGILFLVLGLPGYENAWVLVAVVWFHSVFAVGLAASTRRAAASRVGLAAVTTGSAARSTS